MADGACLHRIAIPGQQYGHWDQVGTMVRTNFRMGDPQRPGFLIADLSRCPLDDRARIARFIAGAPNLAKALHALLDETEALRRESPAVENTGLGLARLMAMQALHEALPAYPKKES